VLEQLQGKHVGTLLSLAGEVAHGLALEYHIKVIAMRSSPGGAPGYIFIAAISELILQAVGSKARPVLET
jgi:hypothetical protein